MKNLIIINIVILIIGLNTMNAKADNKGPPPVVITVKSPGWFSAGFLGCWGDGFCSKDVVLDQNGHPMSMSGKIKNNLDGTLEIRWDMNTFNEKNVEYYKDNTTFINNAEVLLTDDECSGLKLPLGTKIGIGKYGIEKEDNFMIVVVNAVLP